MKGIKKELPLAILILGVGCLFILCVIARAEQINNQLETKTVSYEINK